jgi:hypothetical protein
MAESAPERTRQPARWQEIGKLISMQTSLGTLGPGTVYALTPEDGQEGQENDDEESL